VREVYLGPDGLLACECAGRVFVEMSTVRPDTIRAISAAAVAALLIEIGQRLVLAGENPYKARAYSRAQYFLTLTLPLGEVIAAGRRREIPGVAEALAATIEQLYARGTTPKLEALRADAPVGVLEMLRIRASRPRRSARFTRRSGQRTWPTWRARAVTGA
jgi:DNA polymerase (family X)